MLERASACLDSGVRLSLRAQRRAPKSRRLLHSTFWHHAAGDIDLPLCLLSPVCPSPTTTTTASSRAPQDYALSHPAAAAATAVAAPACSIDVPFLDFLYPAQTLAFMTRASASSTHLDRIWDRRAAHRALATPTATAKGLRAYSSSTTSTSSAASSRHLDRSTLSHTLDSTSPPSPAYHPESLLQKPREELSHLMLANPAGPNTDSLVARAWDLYVIMEEKEQQRPSLIKDLIAWLHRAPKSSAASSHIIRLFAALPPLKRDPSAYDAVIGAYIANDQVQSALKMHEEVLQHAPDKLVGADQLMLYAVSRQDWDMVRHVYNRLPRSSDNLTHLPLMDVDDSQKTISSHDQVPPEIFDLACSRLLHAPRLGKNLQSLARHYHQTTDVEGRAELLHIFGSIWRSLVSLTTIKPAFTAPGHQGNTARAHFRRLFLSIHKTALPSSKIYESCLLSLMATSNQAAIQDFSSVITFIYNLYRESSVFRPSKRLLGGLIRFWGEQSLVLADRHPSDAPMSLQLFIADFTTFHGGLDAIALYDIMVRLARLGDVQGVNEYAKKYKSLHVDALETSAKLWPLVYVHAKRADPAEAARQLHSIKADFGVDPDLRCWNIVIHAYETASQLEGALATLDELLETSLVPDPFSFTPVLNLYAKQGDLDGVNETLKTAKLCGVSPTVQMLNSLILANVNNGDMDRAEAILEEAVKLARNENAYGSLTVCCNTILTGHALDRNIESTMTVYRRMKDENIPLDANTYGALVQVLCLFRQTDVAHKVVQTVMPSDRIRPHAFHYAILMVGYINQGLYEQAVELEIEMKQARVKPTNSTRTALLKAKALLEHQTKGGDKKYDDGNEAVPLQETIEELSKLLEVGTDASTSKQPSHGFRGQSSAAPIDASFLIFIHGKRRAFEAARSIFETYISKLPEHQRISEDAPPIRLITALMSVHFRAREYEEVDRYWSLAFAQAEALRASPGEQPPRTLGNSESSVTDSLESTSPTKAQVPFASRFILSRPLRYYMASQFSRHSARSSSTMTILVSSLLSKGYRLDNRTWNALIVHLCRCSPPRALLAFALTEKFLIEGWPGWVNARRETIANTTIRPKTSVRAARVEYFRNNDTNTVRYRSHGALIPQYKTMVYLASTLLDLRNLEATGIRAASDTGRMTPAEVEEQKEIEKQVGTLKDVRERAPRTMDVVQRMPKVNDRLQQKLIRRV